MIEDFLKNVDALWKPMGFEPIPLEIIGSTALLLQTDYVRATKDTDILEIGDLPQILWETLKEMAGKNSTLAKRHRLYIDLVKTGIPFLPPKRLLTPLKELNEALKHFKVSALHPVDVVVSKLKTFRPSDLEDIKAMIDRSLVPPAQLVERFKLAKEQWLMGSRDFELKKYVENLHAIQRDYLFVEETPCDLPEWLSVS